MEARPETYRAVEVAFVRVTFPENVFAPVHVLMSERSVVDAPVPLPVTHTPLIAKHPAERLIPWEPLDVAVRLKRVKLKPPANVEVPKPCTTKLPVVVAPPAIVRPVEVEPPPIVEDACEMTPPENLVTAENVFVSDRRVVEAEPGVGVVVAITVPSGFTARNVPAPVAREVIAKLLVVAFVSVRFEKILVPLHVFVSLRRVVEAELPPSALTHVPSIAKHPSWRSMPLENVDVAEPSTANVPSIVVSSNVASLVTTSVSVSNES